MATIPLTQRTIWITGASSGIGESLVESLVGRENHLIISARTESRLASIADRYAEDVTILPADVSSHVSMANVRDFFDNMEGGLDTMILAAGDCEYVDVKAFDAEAIDRMMQVNTVGLARCVEAGLAALRRSDNEPHIVGVSSASALTGLPRAEAYGSSKAAVVSLLESLALDLHPEGILVSVVLPGFVDTPLTQRNDFPMPFLLESPEAARRIIAGVEARKSTIAFPWQLIWSLKILGALPDRLRILAGQRMVRG